MRAIVHFSVGVSGMLIILLFVDLCDRKSFVLMFASGFWALVPDLGWLLLRLDMKEGALIWKAIFNSPAGNVFWFAPVIDGMEPVDRVIEMTTAFTLLGVSATIYYFYNDWDIDIEIETR